MVIKIILTGLLFFGVLATIKAQEVEIKDDQISLNGKMILKCKKASPTEYSFYTLNDEEFLTFMWSSDFPPNYSRGDFFILNFLIAKKKIESTQKIHVVAGMGASMKKNMQKLINWLLSEKVLNADGEINPAKLDIFNEKYNENITQKNMKSQ